jgi:hypothetical protein
MASISYSDATTQVSSEIESRGRTYLVRVNYALDDAGELVAQRVFGCCLTTGEPSIPTHYDTAFHEFVLEVTKPLVDLDKLREADAAMRARPGYGETRCG